MAKICLCLTAKTIKRNLEILDKYRKSVDVAELRVDCLEPDERFLIRAFPEQAGLPVILAIRRVVDGGYFAGGEGARINLLAKGLAFANADRRRNFAYVDIEDDLDVPSLEEAARTFGTRVIRSYHNIYGVDSDLSGRIRDMKRGAGDLVKAAVKVNSTADVLRVLRTGRECSDVEKIMICAGQYGVCSRILAERFGSYLSYVSAPSEEDVPKGAESQIHVQELTELYRFRNITSATKVYGELAHPFENTDSPRFFNTVFALEDVDAVYTPFPADSMETFMELARELDVSGLSVTGSCRHELSRFLSGQSTEPRADGVCDTLVRCPEGWQATQAGLRAFSESLLEFLGRDNLKKKRLTVIGSEGIVKSVAFEAHRLGAQILILSRTAREARALAAPGKFAYSGPDFEGLKLMEKYSDIIVMTGRSDDNGWADFLEMYDFSGREGLVDLNRRPEEDSFLIRAALSGCRVLTCYDMLTRRARYQYAQFLGREFPLRYEEKVRFRSKNDE